MVTLDEAAAPLDGLLRPVPPAQSRVCRVCHHVPNPGFDTCWSCSETMRQVSKPVLHIVPITVYQVGEQVWHHLRKYKDSPHPDLREQMLIPILAVLARFLVRHGHCIAPGGWDAITCVPSTRRPEPQHPLFEGMLRVGSMKDSTVNLLSPGPADLGHNRANDQGFVTTGSGSGSVLLVDDTFTTGARLQSAASALAVAGYDVVAAVVIGRVFRHDWSDDHARIWDECLRRSFDPDRCVLCDDRWEVALGDS